MVRDDRTIYISIGGDTETHDGDINTYQLSYAGEVSDVVFTTKETATEMFLSELDRLPATRGRQYVIWFHNIAFDLPMLFPWHYQEFVSEEFDFTDCGWHITGIFSHMCFVTLRKGSRIVHLYGTDSYFKTSLENLAHIYCPHLPKLQTPEGIGTKRFCEGDKKFIDYAARDAVVARIVGENIVGMHNRFQIPLSVSGPHMASRIFRKKFLKKRIPLPSMSIVYASMHSYHGGKNNLPVNRGYYENVKCVDIKSAYPFAMSQLPSFSNPELYFKQDFSPDLKEFPSFGVYRISGIAYPSPWPIIYDHAFKPIIGRFAALWITGFELNQAIASNHIKLEECFGYYYDAAHDVEPSPFKTYVETFYELKETATDKGERNFYKLLLNSLYGKLIESRNVSTLMNLRYDIDKDSHESTLDLIAGTMFNPFIATLITGHTRAYIHALELEYKAIHTSTDGIMTQATDIADIGDHLGQVTIEAEGDALILRNKLYIVYTRKRDEAATHKDGSPMFSLLYQRRYVKKFALHGFFANVQTLELMLKNDVREYEYTKVNKLRESLRRNLKVNRFEKLQRSLNLE